MPFDSEGIWKPDGKKQEAFLALPTTIKEAIIGGGVQTGKTELLLMYGVARKWHENPQFKQVYMRRELNQIRNEVVPRSKQIFNKIPGANYNASYMYWTFESGAQLFLAHCEHEDDVHNWDTTEISLFTPDELTSFTEWMYLYIALERVRSPKGSGLPAITRGAAMPGDVGHSWVKKRWVDPAPEGGKIIVGKGGNKRVYIHATLADSESIDEDYARQLDGLPEAERQAKKFGNWNSYQGQVFGEFRKRRYPDEPENAVHVVEDEFNVPSWWPRLFILDWGFAAMNYLLCGAISPNKRLYCYKERWWIKTKIAEWAPEVKDLIELEQPRIFKVCRSAKQDRGQDLTIQQQIENELEITVDLVNNSPGTRVAGKLLLHEYLRWNPKPIPSITHIYNEEKALWILRNRGLKEYKSYLDSFKLRTPENNLPKLQVFKSLDKLQDTISACVYDKTNPEDVAEFNGDDPYDTIRYMLDEVERYYLFSEKEFQAIEEQQRAIEEFEKTHDWNKIYHRARIGESKSTKFGIRRYH